MSNSYKCLSLIILITIISHTLSLAQDNIDKEDVNVITKYIEDNCKKHNIPAIAFVLIQNDSIVIKYNYGIIENGKKTNINSATNFRLASISKTFTAIAILQLAESGALNVNDKVIKHLPYFSSKDKKKSDKITIAHLLSHTSGIPRNAFGLQLAHGGTQDEDKQVKQLKKISLFADPGTKYKYSDFNFYILQKLISQCSGIPYSKYMTKNVFYKIGMNRTGFFQAISKMGNLAIGHNTRNGIPYPLLYTNPYTINAGDGVYSNANDIGNYIKFIINKGIYNRDTLISSSSFKQLHNTLPNRYYGYGWFSKKSHNTLQMQHGGEAPNYGADLYIYPNKKIGFALLCNYYTDFTYTLGRNIDQYLFVKELKTISQTTTESRAKASKWLFFINITLGLGLIISIFLFILRVIKRNKKTIKLKDINYIVILKTISPIIIGVTIVKFAIQKITVSSGSISISRIYEHDLVNNILLTLLLINLYMLLLSISFIFKNKYRIK